MRRAWHQSKKSNVQIFYRVENMISYNASVFYRPLNLCAPPVCFLPPFSFPSLPPCLPHAPPIDNMGCKNSDPPGSVSLRSAIVGMR